MSIDDDILNAKLAGTYDWIQNLITPHADSWDNLIAYLLTQENNHELGPHWAALFKMEFKRRGHFESHKGALLSLAMQTANDNQAKCIFDLTKKYHGVHIRDIKSYLITAIQNNWTQTSFTLIDYLDKTI